MAVRNSICHLVIDANRLTGIGKSKMSAVTKYGESKMERLGIIIKKQNEFLLANVGHTQHIQ